MFADLATAVKELGAADPNAFTDEELSEAVVELARERRRLEAAEARIAATWDRRQVWAVDGARSGSAWLARETRDPSKECGARLWLGRVVGDMPQVGEAWAAGDIGAAHVRRLAGARNRRTRALFGRDEAVLVHQALTLTFDQFTQAVDYWLLRADPDGAEQSDMDRRDRRRVSLDRTFGGMFAGSMILDPISGEIVSEELRRREQELFEADWREAKARLGRDPRAGELARTPAQRRADALVEMARRSGTMPKGGKAPRPLFTLVLGRDGFNHLSQLASGQVLPPEAILPWIAEADLERVLFANGSSRVISVSRKRNFTGALRRLIEVRDQFCTHKYCDIPAHRCQADHIQPWSEGGVTAQGNGQLACGYHNRLRHRRRRGPPAE